jgi:hypothetical protein
MKRVLLLLLITAGFFSCSQKEKYDPIRFLSHKEQKEVLAQIISYVDKLPQGSTYQSRFDDKYKDYFKNRIGSYYNLYRYFVDEENRHYFFVIKTEASLHGNKRGIGGSFKLENNRIKEFKEVFVTPKIAEQLVKERGEGVFNEMVKQQNINKFIGLKTFVEWPDSTSVYDTVEYRWKALQ